MLTGISIQIKIISLKKIICDNLHKPHYWRELSRNPNVTVNDIKNYPDIGEDDQAIPWNLVNIYIYQITLMLL